MTLPKRYILLIFIFLGIQKIGQSQQIELRHEYFGNQYFSNGDKMSKLEIKELLSGQPESYDEYVSGRKQRTIGNILSGVGLAGAVASISLQGDKTWNQYSTGQKVLSTGSIAAIFVGSLITFSGEKKVIWSYKDFCFTCRLADPLSEDSRPYALINYSLYDLNRKRIKKKETKQILRSSPLALRLYKKSIAQENIAFGLMGLSIGGLIYGASQGEDFIEKTSGKGVLIGSLVAFGGAITFAIISSSKRTKSFMAYNEDCNCLCLMPEQLSRDEGSWAFGSTSNGLGILHTF